MFKDFTKKDFVEQVTILQEIESQKLHEAIPELFALCTVNDPHDQVQFMAENTLRALLSENEEQTVKGLETDSSNIKKICMQVSGLYQYASAVPVLMNLLSEAPSKTSDSISFFEILSALSKIHTPETLDLFKRHMHHPDPLISELSIEALGSYGALSPVDDLCKIIEESESDDRYEECEVITASAIETLGRLRDDKSIVFLVSKIHHRNPTARRFVHQALVNIGEDVIPFLVVVFDKNNVDLKIMAANIIGQLGGKKAGDILVKAVDTGSADHPNIMFAIYEALGKIPSMKSLICLTDGLTEKDKFILMAVVCSLNNQVNPGLIKQIKHIITTQDDQGQRVVQAIVASRADTIFEALYQEAQIGRQLVDCIAKSNNQEIISTFAEKLEQMPEEKSTTDARKLRALSTEQAGKKVLAVDDSTSILHFYQSIASDMGLDITTAVNGKDALDLLEKGEMFDLILTDMNMPVMDGIEMTQKVRKNQNIEKIPIIMATTESKSTQNQLAKKAGVNDFIKKPFTAAQLKEYIKKSFGQ